MVDTGRAARQPSIDSTETARAIVSDAETYRQGWLRTIALAVDDARTDEQERVLLLLDEALDNLVDARTSHEVRGYVKAHL